MEMQTQKRKMHRGGFTLVELLVALALLAIVIGISIPSLISYQKSSHLQKNTAYAQELFGAAQAGLAHYQANGMLDQLEGCSIFMMQHGDLSTKEAQQLQKLVAGYLDDAELFQASIVIEIDPKAGIVQRVIYYDGSKRLSYQPEPDAIDISKITPQNQKEYALGIYSAS